jgi:hypothetical protein
MMASDEERGSHVLHDNYVYMFGGYLYILYEIERCSHESWIQADLKRGLID